jgi:hypothetical protein
MKTRKIGCVLLLCVLVSGCGGGSGGGVTTPTPPTSHTLSYTASTTLSVGDTHPKGVLIADFNGDGKPDVALSLFDTNSIAVFLNQGSGTFGSPILTALQIPNGLGTLALGDFNEDGKADLIVSTISGSAQDNIVLLGNGDGTFTQQTPLNNSCGSLTTVVVELTDDQHQDVVFGCNGGLQVYLGHGDGTFSGPNNLPVISFPGTFFGVAVADFNGDGKPDIAAVDTGSPNSTNGSLDFYAGNGDGTFANPTTTALPLTFPTGLSAGDFNGDGKIDLLVGYPSAALINYGNGDGTFLTSLSASLTIYSSSTAVQGDAVAVLAAELQKDSSEDAITADYSSGSVQIALNSALGVPPPNQGLFTFALAPGTASIATGDLNGDGILDVAISNYETGDVTIILSSD